MEYTNRQKTGGFTLIELLVVISILGFLATTVMASLNDARKKSYYAKAAADRQSLIRALELYYDDRGYYPPGGNAIMNLTTLPGGGWNTLATHLQPYLNEMATPAFPSVGSGGNVYQGYVYSAGTKTSPAIWRISDSLDGSFVACVSIYDGYWIDFILPQQSALNRSDGGVDPDGIDSFGGNYVISANLYDCI